MKSLTCEEICFGSSLIMNDNPNHDIIVNNNNTDDIMQEIDSDND